MTTAYTSLLGLALPTTGELQGTWGDTVNNSITSLLDSAVAGTTTLSTDGDVTLSTTTGAANQARQAILLCSGARTAIRTITAPAQSKIYTVINNTSGGYAVKLVGVGPTTGVSIPAGSSGTFAWNGSDFVDASNYINGNKVINGNLTVTGTATFGSNVGIGIAPVTAAGHLSLTLDGTSSGAGGLISIYRNGVASGYIRGNSAGGIGTNFVIGATTGNGIQFLVNGTTTVAATLDSNSNWLVGTTTNTAPYKAIITGTNLRYGLQVKGNYAISLTENSFANDGTNGVVIGQYGSTYPGGSNFGVGALGSFVAGGDAAPFAVGTTSSQPLWLGTNNSFVAQIDTNGRTQFGAQSLPSGCTSYLLLSRTANNNTDAAMTIYNSSTGTAAVASLILGNSTYSNVGGIAAFGGNYTSSGQNRPNQTYIWNNVNGSAITLHQEQANGSIYNAIGGTTVSTVTSSGLRINSGNIGLDIDPASITYDPNYRLLYMGNSGAYGIIYGSSNGTGGSNEWGQTAWQNNTRFYNTNNYAIGTGASSSILQSGGAIYMYSAPSVSAGAVQTVSQRSKFDLNGFTTINTANVTSGNGVHIINHPIATGSNTYQNGFGFLTANMATNAYATMIYGGASATTNNSGYMAFQYVGGSGSPANKLSWGLWSNDNLMQLDGYGRLSINQSTQYGILNMTPLAPSWGEGIVINPAYNGYSAIFFRKEGATGSTYTNTWTFGKNSSSFNGGDQYLGVTREGNTGSNLQRADAVCTWGTNGTTYANKLIVNSTTDRYASGYIQQNGGKLIINSDDGNYTQFQIGAPTSGTEASMFFGSGITAYGQSVTLSNTQYGWPMGAGIYGLTPNYFAIGNIANGSWNVRLNYNSTAWAGNSDERIKNIIKPITNALDMIRDWRTVYFTFNHDTSNKVKMGLIAQDVLKTAPELVDIPEDEYNTKGELQTMGVYYAEAVPVLVEAIKELEAKIATLEAKLQGA